MLGGIYIDRLVRPTAHGEIGLAVAIQVEGSHSHAAIQPSHTRLVSDGEALYRHTAAWVL